MINIPYKPLSERMLQEPFWLGLITVFIVLGVIGLVWCAKRHFPEKIEKLLAEEADRNRRTFSISLYKFSVNKILNYFPSHSHTSSSIAQRTITIYEYCSTSSCICGEYQFGWNWWSWWNNNTWCAKNIIGTAGYKKTIDFKPQQPPSFWRGNRKNFLT